MSTLATIDASDLITDSRADLNTNFTNLNTDKIETSTLDTDTALTANSDAKIATQKAVKAYVDNTVTQAATESAKGAVEIGTQAEVNAGTATGGSGASLAVTPATLKAITTPVVRTYLTAVSPATWSKPTGLKYIVVEVQAVGGVGGDAEGASNGGSGGGAGGYSRKLIAAASLGSTETVTIGGAGAASSFGAHCSANQGSVGTKNGGAGGAGGTATGGDINVTGGGGGFGTSTQGRGGSGGNSYFGSGAAGANGDNQNGGAGGNYGGGGGGASTESTGNQTGGAGGPAIVVITEYYV